MIQHYTFTPPQQVTCPNDIFNKQKYIKLLLLLKKVYINHHIMIINDKKQIIGILSKTMILLNYM